MSAVSFKLVISSLVTLGIAIPAVAVDTVEVWDVGATDMELYFGSAGLGAPPAERESMFDMLIGYGITERFSAYFGTTMTADGNLAAGGNEQSVGAFANLRDGEVVDLDLMLNIGSDGENGMSVQPACEVNFDLEPGLGQAGFYTRLGLNRSPRGAVGKAGVYRAVGVDSDVELVFGGYRNVSSNGQLLLEFDLVRHDSPHHGENNWEIGGLALGYNFTVAGAVEMIAELSHDLPQHGEHRTWGLSVGFISTLPSLAR